VVPGAVDVHTHFHTEVGNFGRTADDYDSGSRAAAAGGITTIVNFAFQHRGASLRAAIEKEHAKADGQSLVDYGFHVVVHDLGVPGVLEEIGPLADDGYSSLKIFTMGEHYLNDLDTLRLLRAAREQGVMVNVHAEDEAIISYLTANRLAQGAKSVAELPLVRPPISESLATWRVATYARVAGAAVYIVHLSCRAAIDAVRQARSEGAEVYVETRPAYLYLDESRYALPGAQGNKYVCTPPLRTPDDQLALWDGLRNGEIQAYATDHTTWLAAQKMDDRLSFADIPGGIANVQTSIGMLYAEGAKKGRISLNQFVAVTSTNPAKLFGMWPRKGTLAVGSDADVLIIDPNQPHRISGEVRESRSDFDPYEGYECVGWPVMTFLRGELIVDHGKITDASRRGGRYLKRDRYLPL
jgi:dihydropyrimidinase